MIIHISRQVVSFLFLAVSCTKCFSHGLLVQQPSHRKEIKWIRNHNDVIFEVQQQRTKQHSSGCRRQARLPMSVNANRDTCESILKVEDIDSNFKRTIQRSAAVEKYGEPKLILLSIGSSVLQVILQSPIWQYVLVPMARKKIIDTAQANGIPWNQCKDWLLSQSGPWNNRTKSHQSHLKEQLEDIPTWYQNAAYHAYDTGHLSWNAAVELELASAAIGARNMPKAGATGEVMFRSAFRRALFEAGSLRVPLTSHVDGSLSHIVDIGCGTGTSTRISRCQTTERFFKEITSRLRQ